MTPALSCVRARISSETELEGTAIRRAGPVLCPRACVHIRVAGVHMTLIVSRAPVRCVAYVGIADVCGTLVVMALIVRSAIVLCILAAIVHDTIITTVAGVPVSCIVTRVSAVAPIHQVTANVLAGERAAILTRATVAMAASIVTRGARIALRTVVLDHAAVQ